MVAFLLSMENLKDFFIKHQLQIEAKKFLIAVSGGPDSMALLDLIRHTVTDPTNQLLVGHFDHQLRPDSYLESNLISNYCKKYNLKLFEQRWSKQEQPERGIEAAARKFRYAFLKELVQQNQVDYLLTAHHGDDLIENILLKLIRSGNVKEMNSLIEMGQFEDTQAYLLRPLLKYSKTDLLHYVKVQQLSYIQDSTNFEDKTLRNRLRHHVIPLLKNENKKLIKNANRFQVSEAELAESQNILFKNLSNPQRRYFTWTGNLSDLQELRLNQKKLYFEWLTLTKFHQQVHFESLEEKANFRTKKDGIGLILYQNKYYLYREKDLDSEQIRPFKVYLDKIFNFKGKNYLISKQKLGLQQVGSFYSKENLSLKVGSLPEGQKLVLATGNKTKAKKKFAEKGIPNILRSNCLTILSDDGNEEVQYIMNVYRRQIFDPAFIEYRVYEI
ncbi:tRNA lysidine(34) synthetase TilS [Lactobacillus sp. PV034]|uniref:tRNA lysidine(34) synthetase TilS n=1 Tax=Lactobacillus sp. PV034 TaxID=2594495 RepID=UPI00223F0511|nr:tRNA lysidine(34) synthetase TilS [Lactobacillus sp. PV034]QNQ81336.1 tRNA lysidine(34) synthetase TilS [Lactobacillus sp. PV034]